MKSFQDYCINLTSDHLTQSTQQFLHQICFIISITKNLWIQVRDISTLKYKQVDIHINKPYDEVLGAAQLIKLEIHLIVETSHFNLLYNYFSSPVYYI